MGALSSRAKWPKSEASNSPSFTVEVKNERSHTFTFLLSFYGVVLN
jgi:hypothetical protein